MKKLISLALALVMILSLATVAFADDDETPEVPDEPNNGITLTKTFTNTNSNFGGKLPNSKFYFTTTFRSYTDEEGETSVTMTNPPALTVGTPETVGSETKYYVAYNNSDTTPNTAASATINIPVIFNLANFSVGTYEYVITETNSNVAGITYDAAAMTLTMQVFSDSEGNKTCNITTSQGDKKDTDFTNSYAAGQLQVKKVLAGNSVDPNKKFTFTVTFASTKTFNPAIDAAVSTGVTPGFWDKTGLVYTVSLGHNDTVTFSNIPADVTYTVAESEVQGYTAESVYSNTSTTKAITGGLQDTVTVTNTNNTEINTGVILESAPYILLLALAAAGMFLLLTKKRSREY